MVQYWVLTVKLPQVPHASVNGVPTLTGGKGHNELRRFYSEDFLNAIPGERNAPCAAER